MIPTAFGPVPFGISDAADIIATSILAYYLLLLIRGTRAVQITLGLFVLVIVLAISNVFHLLVLATVIQYLLLGTAVTLPVVFQPELRRGLEQLGRGRLFTRAAGEADDEAVDRQIAAVAQAAFTLAGRRIGALVVLEGRTGLREYVESGTTLDARLSHDLLVAIFQKASPLHDGAAIVRDGTIEGAGCFLPLSENTVTAGRHVGTRHRAAIGLSEQTDAAVVVVSEETGAVSIARAGRLSVTIEGEDRLVKVLGAILKPQRRKGQAASPLLANLLSRVPRAVDRPPKLPT